MTRLRLLRMELWRIHVLSLYLHLRIILILLLWHILHFPPSQVHVLRMGGIRERRRGMYILPRRGDRLNLWHMRLHSIHVWCQRDVLLVGRSRRGLTSLER